MDERSFGVWSWSLTDDAVVSACSLKISYGYYLLLPGFSCTFYLIGCAICWSTFFLPIAFIEWRDPNFCFDVSAAWQHPSKFDSLCSASRRPHFFDLWRFLRFLIAQHCCKRQCSLARGAGIRSIIPYQSSNPMNTYFE